MTEKGGVQSVERIFQLIEQLASHPAGASLQRLAQETGLAKSTVHRLLASLVSLGYAAQEPETGRYRLTLKMFELSSGIVNSMEIMDVAKAHLERLSQRTGEAVHLVIRDARDIVYIYKTESGPMRMSSRVGLRSPLYCTGVGKAILATLPPEEVEDVWNHSSLKKLTSRTVVDLAEMQDQLAEVRANGYAIDDEENEMGVRCVAVAIPGPDGRAESAFSISGLAPYMTPERIRRVAALALDTRTDILADLGVSSMQIDNPKRGFSFKVDGPLDLRLNQEKGISAAECLDTIEREELAGMLYENSDEPYCEELAKAITDEIRRGNRIDTTTKLREIIEKTLDFLPEKEKKETVKKTCQRVFQALRIDVNQEFEVLYEFMEKLPNALRPGGRAAILTFHSGEDKLVKAALKEGYRAGIYKEYSKDVVRPSAQECVQNPRARSTKMRWAIRADE